MGTRMSLDDFTVTREVDIVGLSPYASFKHNYSDHGLAVRCPRHLEEGTEGWTRFVENAFYRTVEPLIRAALEEEQSAQQAS